MSMWPDKETEIDYLNFGYMVDMVVDIATNRKLSPSTIGLYGDWGSGKSSLMKLAQKKIEEKNSKIEKEKDTVKTLCIEFNGWLLKDMKTLRPLFVVPYWMHWLMRNGSARR